MGEHQEASNEFPEFVELPEFTDRWFADGGDEDGLWDLETQIAKAPGKGDFLAEGGGIQKLRWPSI